MTDIRVMIASEDQILALARAYAAAERLPMTTVSSRVFNDGKKLARILSGHDLTIRRSKQAVQWFSDHWPDGIAWPDDITRPARTLLVAEAS